MGGTSSSPASVTPVLESSASSSLSAQDVALQVRALGRPYEAIADNIEENGLDGPTLLNLVESDLPDIFKEIGVTSTLHQRKLETIFKAFLSSGDSGAMVVNGAAPPSVHKMYAGFLSHFKHECGTEARLVQKYLKDIMDARPLEGCGSEVFLDSDDLSDLRMLLDHVKESQVLVLLQSRGVLTRPWVIMELHTAITNGVPVVALNVQKASCSYDYAAASEYLLHFDKDIDIANPGAAQLLIDWGIDPVDCAYLLSDSLPNVISTNLDPNGSERQIQASLEDLADAMRKAVPIAPSMGKEEWLAMRAAQKLKSSMAKKEHGSSSGGSDAAAEAEPQSTRILADVPGHVPELPGAYLVRDEDLTQLKAALLMGGSASGTALTSKKQQNKVGAHGMVSSQWIFFCG